ncbi:acyltransferase family protein [Adhaeribacter aquaticus]|uniref:acyltransferase family protein n=1 Tax=Adhaeribacter aquaticus TaxID=299567 RepID=UPI0003F90630|nr:acyltransferase [Adhaeribacter aquaticus]
MRKDYQQINVIKGFAIISVIILHSIDQKALLKTYSILHIWQAVPLFIIIMGLNAGMSIATKQPRLPELYTKTYFRKKFDRILFPFILVFIGSILLGYSWYWVIGNNKIDFRLSNLMGVLPVAGPGNYFITLTFQSILLLPLIKYGFKYQPFFTLISLVLLEVAFLLISDNLKLFTRNNYLYSAAFPRYFSAIAFGLVLSKLVFRPARATKIILITSIALISIVYLIEILYGDLVIPHIKEEWKTQNILTFSYAAFLILILFKALPDHSENKLLAFLASMGKSSYHIFLFQIVYFGLINEKHHLPLNLLICLLAGFLFCRYEKSLFNVFFPPKETKPAS